MTRVRVWRRLAALFAVVFALTATCSKHWESIHTAQWSYGVRTVTYPCASYLDNMNFEYELAVDAARRGDTPGRGYHYNRYVMWRSLYLQHCT